MSLLSKVLYRRPRVEEALSSLDKNRMKLPSLQPHLLFQDFGDQPVTIVEMPMGPWSSPIADTVMLAKLARCAMPKRILEVGSYRGYTAKMLARNTCQETRIVAFDMDPKHGEAYRGSEFETKIERRVGAVSPTAFPKDEMGSYDFIFLDADHTYDAVKHDTEILLPLLSDDGFFIWHDYANWGRFSRKNGVPEFLAELANRIPVASVAGSWLAIHSPRWSSEVGRSEFEAACANRAMGGAGADPWTVDNLRG